MTSAAEARFRIDAPNSRPRASRSSRSTRRARRGEGAGAAPMEPRDVLHRLGVRRARRAAKASPAGCQRYRRAHQGLIDEINTADLVVMVATAGENAQAASVIGEACSLKRVTTTGAHARWHADIRRGASKTLSQLAPLGPDAGRCQRRGIRRGHAAGAAGRSRESSKCSRPIKAAPGTGQHCRHLPRRQSVACPLPIC